MSEQDTHIILWESSASGKKLSVNPMSHRLHRIVTVAIRGLIEIKGTHNLEQAEEYEKSITGIARRIVGADPDQLEVLDTLRLDEIDNFVATVISESELVFDGGSLDGDLELGKSPQK